MLLKLRNLIFEQDHSAPAKSMDLVTRHSLLERIKGSSADADWQDFYRKYSGVILGFAQKQGLDEHSACDALQETMMVLMRKLRTFEYDTGRGRFRNWLLTIVANKVREARRRSHMDRLLSMDAVPSEAGGSLHEQVASEEAGASENLEEAWRQSLIDEALQRVLSDPHTRPETVEVFRACALEGQPVAAVAARFGLKDNAVYQIKNRMLTRLKEIIASLESENGERPANTEPEQ